MRIVIVGPGRAGGSLAIAAIQAGHPVVAVVARRRQDQELARLLDVPAQVLGDPLPAADLLVLAVRDDALDETAHALAAQAPDVPRSVVHLSGLVPVQVLSPLAEAGIQTGSFHPLQTLPDWHTGARSLAGAGAALTAQSPLLETLENLVQTLGMTPFRLADQDKPLYHAGAAASSNFLVTALHLGAEIFARAGVDFQAARPLVEAVVANVFDQGARAALTGPIARADVATVSAQLAAVEESQPELAATFRDLGKATARLAGTASQLEDVWS